MTGQHYLDWTRARDDQCASCDVGERVCLHFCALRSWLHIKDFDHCDPKRCSGKKLARLGLIKDMKVGQRFRGIVVT